MTLIFWAIYCVWTAVFFSFAWTWLFLRITKIYNINVGITHFLKNMQLKSYLSEKSTTKDNKLQLF